MSNTQVVKDIYAAFGRGDIAGILGMLTDDVRWDFEAPAEISFAGSRRGIKETSGFFEGLAKDHTDPKLDMTHFIESGDEVAAFGRYEATARNTGMRTSTPIAHYWKIRGGKVAQYIGFANTAAFVEAMKASAASA